MDGLGLCWIEPEEGGENRGAEAICVVVGRQGEEGGGKGGGRGNIGQEEREGEDKGRR